MTKEQKRQMAQKISDMFNPELYDDENAKNIGVSSDQIKRWRKENNIKYLSRKYRTDRKIERMFNPELSDKDNAKIIGVSPNRIRNWREENKINQIKVCEKKKLSEYEIISSLYNIELNVEENAKIIGVSTYRIYEWEKDNQEVLESKLNINDDDWKTIDEYPNYKVSRFGQVFSKKTKQILQPLTSIDGYVCYALMKDNKRKNVNVNRLVAKTFIPNPENKPNVIHIDGDRSNNIWTNLKWGHLGDSEKFRAARQSTRNMSYISN